MLVAILYEIPGYDLKSHPASIRTFINDLSNFLETVILCTEHLLIKGDFKVALTTDEMSEEEGLDSGATVRILNALCLSCGFKQQ